MEIAQAPKGALKIKGKHATLFINPSGKHDGNATILLRGDEHSSVVNEEDGVVIASPGEYEIGGIKIRGTAQGSFTVYTLTLENTTVLLGTLTALEKVHSKLQEHDIVLVDADSEQDVAFISPLASKVMLLAGEKAEAVVQSFEKETVVRQAKFSTTKDKLSQEGQTVLLV